MASLSVLLVPLALVVPMHTDSDVVAVPAGAEAEVGLEPTHGCGDSPTTSVLTRVPVAGARGAEVEGWTVTSSDDGDGRTVIEWTGGTLAADATGEFPVTFTAPDTPGELVTFPFIQTCENGEELAWIQGDPEGEFPAPRVLILPAGSTPAATLDDVPADAPGRSQLTEIVDVDNPADEGTTTSTTATTATTAEPTTTTAPTSTTTTNEDDDEDDSGNSALPIIGVVLVVLAVGAAVLYPRMRRGR